MEDQHRWRDQVEISLDNRQIFLLFSAAAVVVSLVFALGVVVGKRLERDGDAARRTDPLALLDQLSGASATDETGLTFSQELMDGAPTPAPAVRRSTANATKRSNGARSEATAAQRPAAKRRDEVKPETDRPAEVVAATPPKPARNTPKGAAGSKREEQSDKGAYTLQLSSFQDRLEARQFTEKLLRAGLKPQVRPTEIPGRGMWYRVRLGRYTSWEKAVSAKQDFEREHQVIAYVARD